MHAARAGDVGALGGLLTRHRASLLAVAISVVGYGPDAEDAVQETSLIALSRIGDLRDPAAAGPWLRTVVRNVCRARLRCRTDLTLGDGLAAVLRSSEPDPTELLDRHATRDWVWHALEQLSSPLRLVLMLRYFSGVTAYQDIAVACGVPVGTVRSRLHEARGKLSQALLSTADAAHGDVRAVTAAHRRHLTDILEALPRGQAGSVLADSWSPTVAVSGPGGFQGEGYVHLVRGLEQDLADGVGHGVTNVVAGRDLAVCEFELRSPPEDPAHCPPGAAWVLRTGAGRVLQARLVHLRRPPALTA
ncbi:RNA polymerase sigma factor [Lentzea sp. NPDC058436]|uniref:RNA polymerase sigma factor n=1 Tax=Lentzea sp. NPDC058436 TaxID=3346499 RepID=UPI00366318D8